MTQQQRPPDTERAATTARRRELAAWLGTALLHLVVVYTASERFPFVLLELPLLALLTWAASRQFIAPALPLSFASAICYLLAEPAVAFSPALWLCLVPQLLLVASEHRRPILFLQGLWTGWIIASGIYAWVWPAAGEFFDRNWTQTTPIFLVLTLLVALQLAAFFPLLSLLRDWTRWPLGVIAPGLYVIVEHFVSLPTSIPLPLGLVFHPLLLQTLELAGVAGVTLLVASASAALYEAFVAFRTGNRRRGASAFAIATAIIGAQVGYGIARMDSTPASDAPSITVAMIQPVSPLKVSNSDAATQQRVSAKLKELSLKALEPRDGKRPDVLFWPEGAAHFAQRTPEFNPPYRQALVDVQTLTSTTLVVHNIQFFRETTSGKVGYQSAITVVEPVGHARADYHKVILFPFGEYLPFEQTVPILRKWFPQARNIKRGDNAQPLDGPGAPFAPLICYEALFPAHVRTLARGDVGYIAVLTNDRWYGVRQQPPQHLAFSILRAIENRKPLVRSANSGISAIIRADGVIADRASTPVMEETILRGTITPRFGSTLYNRAGDFLPRWILGPAYALLFLLAGIRRAATPNPPPKPTPARKQRARRNPDSP